MIIMYLSKEKFSCPKEQFSFYITVLKQYINFKNSMIPDINSIVNGVDPDQIIDEKTVRIILHREGIGK